MDTYKSVYTSKTHRNISRKPLMKKLPYTKWSLASRSELIHLHILTNNHITYFKYIYINEIYQLPCINLKSHLLIIYIHTNFSKYVSLGGPYWKTEIQSTSKYSSKWPCPLNTHTSSLYTQLFISPKYNLNYPLHYKHAKIWLYIYSVSNTYHTACICLPHCQELL